MKPASLLLYGGAAAIFAWGMASGPDEPSGASSKGSRNGVAPPLNPDMTGGGEGGQAFLANLPGGDTGGPTPARETAILQAVKDGHALIEWSNVMSEIPGHTAQIPVMRRVLRIGTPEDSVRVNASFRTLQAIADELSAMMLTSKVSDLIHQQADFKTGAHPQNPWVQDGSMAETRRMRDFDHLLSSLVANDAPGLISDEGKDWVLTQRFFKALGDAESIANWPSSEGVKGSKHNSANFGFYGAAFSSKSPGGLSVAQSIGLAHNKAHSDYSQLLRLMGQIAIVDGQEMNMADLLRDPVLSKLVSDEGPLPGIKHPDFEAMAA